MERNAATFSTRSRQWRFGLLAACVAAAAIQFYATAQCTVLIPRCANPGFSVTYLRSSASALVTNVVPTSASGRAGLAEGDRIDEREIAFPERWQLRGPRSDWPLPAQTRITYPVHRGVTTQTISFRTPIDIYTPGIVDWVPLVGNLWGLLLAALLAARRPDLFQARVLALTLISYCGFGNFTSTTLPWWPQVDIILTILGGSIFLGGPMLMLAVLASSYGRPLSMVRKLILSITCALVVVYTASIYLLFTIGWYVFALPVEWMRESILGGVAQVAVLGSVVVAAIATRGIERSRILWILVSITPYWLLSTAVGFRYVDQRMQNIEDVVLTLAGISVPLGLTYAVLSRRCIDVGYVLNRAIVFGAISSLVVVVFVLIEYVLNSWVTSVGHTTSFVLGMFASLILGLSLRLVHRRVETIVDFLFFRKRHEDDAALHQFAREAAFVTQVDVLLTRTVEMVRAHTGASNAVIFVRAVGGYVAREARCSIYLNENDPAVLAMRASHAPVNLYGRESRLHGELAFPLTARGDVVGILVCGLKHDGQAYGPGEIGTLSILSQSIGIAFDSLRSREDKYAQVLDELRAIRAILSQVVASDGTTSVD